MGFFDSLKRSFGFDAVDDNDIEIEGKDATVRPLSARVNRNESEASRPVATPRKVEREPVREPEPELRPDPSVIFEKVVAMFNETLPGFLQKSVDPARQRQALYDALDGSIKDYFDHLDRNVERRLSSRFENDRRKLQAQIDELRVKALKEEEGISAAKNLQLSAERQKRALSERVHDLEKQLATLQAENEQFILENKSMANKLRMLSITGDNADEAMAAEMEKLHEQISELQKLASETEKRCAMTLKEKIEVESRLQEATDKIEELRQRSETQTTAEKEDVELLARLQKEHAELQQKLEESEFEVARLNESLEQAKVKDELGVAMVNDLNSKAHEAKNEAKAAKDELTKAREEAQDARNMVAELEGKLTAANEQMAILNGKLSKAQEDLGIVKEVQQEVLKLEENQRITEAKIRSQKDELMEKEELLAQMQNDLASKTEVLRAQEDTIRRLEDQADSLRKNVETTLYEKSQVESALRSEIDRLKSIKGSVPELEMTTPVTVVTVVDNPEDEAMANDLPEFIVPKQEKTSTPKPRRGRPPKQKLSDNPDSAEPMSMDLPDTNEDADIDLLDSTDWLVATPAEDVKPKKHRKQKAQADDNFGYKEPERQEPPDNPAQMLLW